MHRSLSAFLAHMRRPGVILVLLSFVVYNANLAHASCSDDVTFRFLPLALIRHGTPTLEPYVQHFASGGVLHWRLLLHEGRAVPIYPPGAGLLAVPVYLVPSLIWSDLPVLLLSKVSASLMTALSVGFVYATARRLGGSTRQGILIGCVYAFATPVFAVAAQSFCQHPAALLLVSAVLYCVVRARSAESGWPTLAAVALGGAVAVRPQILVGLIALGLYVFYLGRRERGTVVFAAALPSLATLGYNLAFTGRILGGYGLALAEFPGIRFGNPIWLGATGLLFSPGVGLFVYSPVALFAVAGAVRAIRRHDPLYLSCGFGIVFTVLFVGAYNIWWGGGTWGPRFLVEMMPLLALLIFVVIRPPSLFSARPMIAGTFVVLSIVAVTFQAIGAFSPHCSWSRQPVAPSQDRSRLWNWTDPPFVRCARQLQIGGDRLSEITVPTERTGPPPSYLPPVYRPDP